MSALEFRSLEPERLDEEVQDPDELATSLEQVDQVNRWLGGDRSLRGALADLRGESLRLLDVGTGDARTLDRTLGWGSREGAIWTGVGVDRSAAVAACAAARSASPLLRADALALPLADDSVDVALCTLTLHHFTDAEAVTLLREMARVARRRVIVSDLERHRLALLSARLLAATVWRGNRLTRHDGPLSVRRAFTPAELRELGRRASLPGVCVRRHWPWRLSLVARP